MRGIAIIFSVLLLLSAVGCNKKGESGEFPNDFVTMSDTEKMAYMMKEVEPDSVARFLADASLGKLGNIKINDYLSSFSYAYEHYSGDNQETFSQVIDDYVSQLPLPENYKMKKLQGMIDPDAIGYHLGLEYVGQIREKNLSEKEVTKEISEFKNNVDDKTYERFLTGFNVAIENDHGKDIPEWLYGKYR